jgi:hypothetical protein
MPVTIIKKKYKCIHCKDAGKTAHVIESMGKRAIMTLPCCVCTPLMRGTNTVPYLGLRTMQPIAPDHVAAQVGLAPAL